MYKGIGGKYLNVGTGQDLVPIFLSYLPILW